jgi:hypothetical protein
MKETLVGTTESRLAVRRLSAFIEAIHGVVYFAPEPAAEYAALGLRGYWRGYFAGRAAPLGPVGPEVVTALFAGFAPAMVARAFPSVWAIAEPARVQAARLAGATAALHRLLGLDQRSSEVSGLEDSGLEDSVAAAVELTGRCVRALPLPGRPMAAAQAGLARPTEPLAALWHDCTVLREFRGDGHLAAVAVAGLVWPEPHLLQGRRADQYLVDPRLQEHRGWDDETWQRAAERVRGRDLNEVEAWTDDLAAAAFAVLSGDERAQLGRVLKPLAAAAAVELPFPNAMGLQPPE